MLSDQDFDAAVSQAHKSLLDKAVAVEAERSALWLALTRRVSLLQALCTALRSAHPDVYGDTPSVQPIAGSEAVWIDVAGSPLDSKRVERDDLLSVLRLAIATCDSFVATIATPAAYAAKEI